MLSPVEVALPSEKSWIRHWHVNRFILDNVSISEEINFDSQVVTSNAGYTGGSYKYPFQDPSLPWDQRVDDLVGRLTIDEIAKQTAVRIMIAK